MIQLESKTAIAKANQEKVYDYLSDFRNMENLLPKDIMNNVEVHEHNCKFEMNGIGTIGLMISEKIPYSQIRITGTEKGSADFTLLINLTTQSENSSGVKFLLNANLNLFLEIMAKKPLQQFIDMLADKIEQKDFSTP